MAAPDFAAQNFYTETVAPLRNTRLEALRIQLAAPIMLAEIAADLLTSLAGFVAAYRLYAYFFGSLLDQPLTQVLPTGVFFALLYSFLQYRDGAYRADGGVLRIRETERALRVTAQSLFLTQILNLLLCLHFPIFVCLIAAVLVPVLLVFQKRLFLQAVARFRQKYMADLRVLIYGAGDAGRNIASVLLDSPRLGLQPVAVIDDRPGRHGAVLPAMGYHGRTAIPFVAGALTTELLQSFQPDLLLIAAERLTPEGIATMNDAAALAGVKVGILSSPALEELQCAAPVAVDGMLFAFPAECRERRFYAVAKRILDLLLSPVLLVLVSPLLVAIAVLIQIDSPGPSLFVQKRVGKDGSLFRMYKFRTMYASTPSYELSPTTPNDRRITRIGRSLRRTSLDELPQLINVLLGNMSLVGPRPEMPFVVEHYTAEQRRRLEATPGITGLWQLSADRAFPIHQNLQYDLYYIRNRTFSMDIAILIHTLLFATRGGI